MGNVSFLPQTATGLRMIEGTLIDITERKRADEALRESEEKYRSLVSNVPDVVWTLSSDFRLVFISKNI